MEDGKKLNVKTSCICDGTLIFAVHIMQELSKIGATNITVKSEKVENPNPKWMSCRFIAEGIIWNTNNFKKMHGLPITRKCKRKRVKKDA